MHTIIREHPLVSGFAQTGVPEDEGQHLQSVYKPAKAYGGPGKYIFDKNSYMNEHHILATSKSAKTIMEQWENYYDPQSVHYIEKSPPNLIRTRFLQKLFPNSKFVVIFRHPVAVSYATQKWSKSSISSLLEHTLRGYEIFLDDMPHLSNVYVFRYEDFVNHPQEEIDKIYGFLGIETMPIRHTISSDVNNKYFTMWLDDRKNKSGNFEFPVTDELEKRANQIGYSMNDCENLLVTPILGAHTTRCNCANEETSY